MTCRMTTYEVRVAMAVNNEGDSRFAVRNVRVTRTRPPEIEMTSPTATHRVYG